MNRIRIPPIFPNQHVTGEQLAQFHSALAARGVLPHQYCIEAVLHFDPEIVDAVCEASYDIKV